MTSVCEVITDKAKSAPCDPVRHRFEQMLANSATAAVCAGPDNLIVSWNSAAEDLFGHRADHAIGKPLSIIIPPRLRNAHDAGLARAVKAGRARLAGHSVDILALHASGTEIPVDLSLSMWFEEGEPMFGALLRDIADRQLAKQRLQHLAHCDMLTSLPNRNALHERLAIVMARAPCSLLLMDLDGFKHVNDTLGHSVGDNLLTAVAARVAIAVGDSGFVARLGGDEFAILLSDCTDHLVLDKLTARVFDCLRPPFELATHSIYVGTSIGIASSPNDASDIERLLSCADLALYDAKNGGGGVRRFFKRAMLNRSEQRRRLSSELHQALARGEFELLYQPQVSLKKISLCGVEALIRWRHPDHGLLAPEAFIALLEESTIAEEVGEWLLEQACMAAADWKFAGMPPMRIAVNLFAAQLRSSRLFDVVSSMLRKHGLHPSQLELEITETTVLRNNQDSVRALKKLNLLGVGIAFDDFGTGFASLSLLQKYPLTCLKIDRGFTASIDRRGGDMAIVKAVIMMADALGLKVVAEGVETTEQEKALLELGCDEAQGFLYGHPMSAADISRIYGPLHHARGEGALGALGSVSNLLNEHEKDKRSTEQLGQTALVTTGSRAERCR